MCGYAASPAGGVFFSPGAQVVIDGPRRFLPVAHPQDHRGGARPELLTARPTMRIRRISR